MASTQKNPGAADAGAQRGIADCGSVSPQINRQKETKQASLIEQINDAHASVEQHLRSGVAEAIRCGELLLEAKRLYGRHGSWTKWLADNVTFSDRLARAYMQLAKLPSEKRQRVADLPLRDALAAIRSKEDSIARAEERISRAPPGPAMLVFHDAEGELVSIPAPGLVIAPEHEHLLEKIPPSPPPRPPATPDEMADVLIHQLAQAAYECTCEPSVLRAAFDRRFGEDGVSITARWRRTDDAVTIAKCILGMLKYEQHTRDVGPLVRALEMFIYAQDRGIPELPDLPPFLRRDQ